MRKEIVIFIVLFFVSCKNNNEELELSPKIEKELFESVYLNKPLKSDTYTVETYVDSSIQKVSRTVLLNILKRASADKGIVVVMETNTGKIKSLVGLEKDEKFNYNLSKNITINTPIEPGGLIKTFDLMSMLEDKKADTSSVYDSNGGKITVLGKTIVDSHLGLKKLSIKEAFLNSSNTIFVQAVEESYGKNPNKFIENFDKFGLGLKQYSQIQCNSSIPSPNSNSWAKITLPWMAFGYGLKLTPIQLLTYYNSIANNGVMVEPLLISKIQCKEKVIKKYDGPITIESWNSKNWGDPLHSKETNKKLQDILRQYIRIGDGRVVNLSKTAISGYSATTQINYSTVGEKRKYASSFVGYFPSEKPKYTLYVYIENPNLTQGIMKNFAEDVVVGIVNIVSK